MFDPQDDGKAVTTGTPAIERTPARLRASTAPLAPADKFDAFKEGFVALQYDLEVVNRTSGAFYGSIDRLAAGPVIISRIAATPTSYDRKRRHVGRSEDGATLFLGAGGRLIMSQGDAQQDIRAGDGFLFQGDVPGRCDVVESSRAWAIKLPARALGAGLAARAGNAPLALPSTLDSIRLISGYIETFSHVADAADPRLQEAFGTHVADLVRMSLGPSRDDAELIKSRGLKAARTEAVLKAIRADFARPDISAGVVGQALGITDRQVHRLLEDTPKSFYEHVLECRLQEAHRLLCDPAALALKVADIAFRAGFTDVTYFNRAFKTRFGETPTGVRGAAVTKAMSRRPRDARLSSPAFEKAYAP